MKTKVIKPKMYLSKYTCNLFFVYCILLLGHILYGFIGAPQV